MTGSAESPDKMDSPEEMEVSQGDCGISTGPKVIPLEREDGDEKTEDTLKSHKPKMGKLRGITPLADKR